MNNRWVNIWRLISFVRDVTTHSNQHGGWRKELIQRVCLATQIGFDSFNSQMARCHFISQTRRRFFPIKFVGGIYLQRHSCIASKEQWYIYIDIPSETAYNVLINSSESFSFTVAQYAITGISELWASIPDVYHKESVQRISSWRSCTSPTLSWSLLVLIQQTGC